MVTPSNTFLSIARARELAELCLQACVPGRERDDATRDALLAASSLLGLLLDVGRGDAAPAELVEASLAAVVAMDDLSDQRPVHAIERMRAEDFVDVAAARADVGAEIRGLALAARARLRLLVGRAKLALEDVLAAEALVRSTSRAGLRAFVLTRKGHALASLARAEEAVAAYGEAVTLARAVGDLRAEVSAMQDEGNLLQQMQRGEEAMARFDASLAKSRAAGDLLGEMRAHAARAYHYLDALDFERSRAAYAAAIDTAPRAIAPRMTALVTGYSALLHLEHGKIERARALASRAVADASRIGYRLAEGVFAAVQAAADARAGDFESAEDRMRFALARIPQEHAYASVVALLGAQVEVARASTRARLGITGSAAAALARAKETLLAATTRRGGEARSLVERVDDARVAARMLAALLEVAAPTELPPISTRDTELARRTEQTSRGRRLIGVLSARAGRPLGARELASAVWPGETLTPATARMRVDELLLWLKESGARDVIRRVGEGYVLVRRAS